MSLRVSILVLILGTAVGLLYWRSAQPEYDPDQLDELARIFERKTEPVRRGQLAYDLPKPEVAQRELTYLADVAKLLEGHVDDCTETERALLQRHAAYQRSARASIFKQAYQIWAERQGQDFVQDMSNEVSMGRSLTSRPVTPTSPDEKLAVLRARVARVETIDAGLATLDRLHSAARAFCEVCPFESISLHTALGYFGN